MMMLYIYSLLGFAFFRPSFRPSDDLYCKTLFQCTVTIIRYGLTGLIDEVTLQSSYFIVYFMKSDSPQFVASLYLGFLCADTTE